MGIVWSGRRSAATGTAATKCHAGRVRTGSMLMCGVLAAAAGVACAGGDSPVPQASPAVVSPSAVCDVVALSEGPEAGLGLMDAIRRR